MPSDAAMRAAREIVRHIHTNKDFAEQTAVELAEIINRQMPGYAELLELLNECTPSYDECDRPIGFHEVDSEFVEAALAKAKGAGDAEA